MTHNACIPWSYIGTSTFSPTVATALPDVPDGTHFADVQVTGDSALYGINGDDPSVPMSDGETIQIIAH